MQEVCSLSFQKSKKRQKFRTRRIATILDVIKQASHMQNQDLALPETTIRLSVGFGCTTGYGCTQMGVEIQGPVLKRFALGPNMMMSGIKKDSWITGPIDSGRKMRIEKGPDGELTILHTLLEVLNTDATSKREYVPLESSHSGCNRQHHGLIGLGLATGMFLGFSSHLMLSPIHIQGSRYITEPVP